LYRAELTPPATTKGQRDIKDHSDALVK
jgi:hypothetical protein